MIIATASLVAAVPAVAGTNVATVTTALARTHSPVRRGQASFIFDLCPVDRPHHYVDDFGDARTYGGFHRHQGIDVFAPRGTPVRAPFGGVAKVSRSSAGGLAVYVYGRRGFVYNGHLTALGHLGKVGAGTVVGYVGNSGDAIGGSTHDHFEWHPGGGEAVDAFKLLNAACRVLPAPKPLPYPSRHPAL